MDFLGMQPTRMLGLFGALAAAAVVLYILKLRRRRVPVPFSPLWERVLLERPTSDLFARLKRLLSLLVQLCLLAALVLSLGDPRPAGAARAGRALVVLVDGSASMKATDVPGTRAEAARRALRELVRGLGPGDRMLVAQMDAEVTALTPMTDDLGALEGAVTAYRPRDTGLDFARALRFAGDAAAGATGAEVVVIGDGAYTAPRDGEGVVRVPTGVRLRFVGVGRRGRNVAVSTFAVRRYPLDKSRYEVLVEVESHSDREEHVELTLRADGAPLDVARLHLAPGARSQRVLENLTGANQTLEAHVTLADGTPDDLPADDVAYATLPPRRRARVLSVTEGNRYLEAALLLDSYLDVTEVRPAQAAAALRGGRFDVAILDGVALPLPPGTAGLYLRPPPGGDAPVEGAEGFINAQPGSALGFTRIERNHPLVRFASDLEEAHVGRIVQYRPGPGDRVIASSAAGAPMLLAGQRRTDRFALLAFDVRESDFPLLVSWPVLVINAMDWFASEDPAYLSSFRTGETWRVPVPAGLREATVETPSGRRVRVPVMEGRAVFFATEAGFHRVHAGDAHTLVASNLSDPQESACAPRAVLEIAGTRATAPGAGRPGLRREGWVLLVAAALAVLAIEWATYHRRVTV